MYAEAGSARNWDPSPRIELYDLKGNRVPFRTTSGIRSLSFVSGRLLFLQYQRDVPDRPDISKIRRQGIRIVTIHTGGTRKVAEHFASTLKIEFPILLDPGSKTAKRFGVQNSLARLSLTEPV